MKPIHIIQRLCLFLLLAASSIGAWATDYGCAGYAIFRSRDVGKNKTVTTLNGEHVKITFSNCKTSGASVANNLIFEPARGSYINVEAADGYAIRWIILRDTEGQSSYDAPNGGGLKRIHEVTPGYEYYFEKNSVSNSGVSGANKNGLDDDDNNIVITQYDATEQKVSFVTTWLENAKQTKFRDIIVGYVKVCKPSFPESKVAAYAYQTKEHGLNLDGYDGTPVITSTNNNVATVDSKSFTAKAEGTAFLTASFPATTNYAKVGTKCEMRVDVWHDFVSLSFKAETHDVIFTKGLPVNSVFQKLDSYLNISTQSGLPYNRSEGLGFSSDNEATLKVGGVDTGGELRWGGTTGTATISAEQRMTTRYIANPSKVSHTFTVVRTDKAGTVLIKDANEWKTFASLVNDKGLTTLNAKLEADLSLGTDITMVGTADHRYAGTFEGDNHSVAFNLSGGDYTAPFSAVQGATLRNLTVTGSISATGKYAGSLVGHVQGKAVTIDHCRSSVAIASSVSGDGTHGGLVGLADNPVNINNCIFSGSMTGANTNKCGGLVGWIGTNGAGSKITNCLITATYSVNGTGSNAVARNANGSTISNVYVLNLLGDLPAGAKQVSAEQIKNGYVAWYLQNGQSSAVWGQSINGTRTDAAPLFSTEAAKKVYRVAHVSSLNNQVMQEKFYNAGQKAEGLSTASLSSYVNNNYKNALTRWFQVAGTGSVTSPVTADQTVTVTVNNNEFFTINSAETWKAFCDYVDGVSPKVSAKMTSNVNLTSASPMAGSRQAYAGKFDGGGYTLTVAYEGKGQATAPFNQVAGATIENLKTAGTIRQTATGKGYPQSHASGLVGSANVVTINNCEVAVAISFTLTGNQDQHSGGFVGHGQGKVITMNNCKFSGSFSGPEGSRTSGIAGLVGWSAGSGSSFNNCYVAGTYKNIVDVHPLVYTTDNITVSGSNNFYCFNGIGASTWSTKGTATAVTSDGAKSGSVTYALQHGTGNKGWSQNLPADKEPMLVFSNPKPVSKVEFVYNNNVKVNRYANTGSKLAYGVPAPKDFLGTAWKDSYYYETFSFSPVFTNESPVSKDTQVAVNIKYLEYFTINSKATWEQFCSLVNNGNSKLAAKMTKDITDAVNTMAGTSTRPYQGSFDGQGHILTLGLFQKTEGAAPFAYVDGATIQGLRTAGTIATSAKYAGGIVGVTDNHLSTVSGCQSAVLIESSVNGDATHGGIVGLAIKPVYIENCAFTGVIHSTTSYNCGGILGWASSDGNTIKNCLVTGTLSYNFTVSNENSEIITRNGGKVEVSNTYYLNAPHTSAKGVRVTEDQLKNGYVASKLQEGQSQSVWAFRLGEETLLHAFSHPDYNEAEENSNYVYYDEGSWHCDYYQLTDGAAYQGSYVDFQADKISYQRSLTAGRRYTLCLPYAIKYSDDMPFRAYALSRSSGGTAVFSQISNGNPLYALMPYLIVMKEGRDRIDFDQSTVKSYDTSLGYVLAGNVKMTGTVKTISNSEASNLGAYTLQNDGSWKKVMTEDASAYIPPFRAYLTVDGGAAGAKIGSVFSDGTTTGVENIILEDNDGTTHIYDLRGIDRGTDFDKLPAGVYIRGGKKVVKK